VCLSRVVYRLAARAPLAPLLLVFALAVSVAARGQTLDEMPAPEAVVARVDVESDGDPEAVEAARTIFGIRAGDRWDPSAVRLGIKRVFLTGPWADVQVFAAPGSDGIRLVLRLLPDRVVSVVEVKTGGAIDDERMRRLIDISPGDRFREDRIEAAKAALLEACETLGYRQARVTATVEPLGGPDYAVRLVVDEGPPTVVRTLEIDGDPNLARGELESVLGLEAGVPFDRQAIDDGLARVTALLVDRRHLAVEAAFVSASFVAPDDAADNAPDVDGADAADVRDVPASEVDVILRVNAGPRYRVVFEGNRVIPGAYLKDRVNARKIGKLDGQSRERALRSLERFYQDAGFALVTVDVDEVPAYRPHADDAERLLRFTIDEGPRARIEEIVIEGASAKDPAVLVADVWDYVRAETPSPSGLFQRIDPGDLVDVLSPEPGRGDGERAVELSDQWFGLLPPFGFQTEPVYSEPLFAAATERLIDLYRSDGFLEVEVDGPEPMFMDAGKAVRVRYRISEGPRVVVAGVRFTPAPTLPLEDLLSVATFEPGEPADLYAIEETRTILERTLKERGFPFARVSERLERRSDGQADVVFQLDEGARVRVGNIRIRGNAITQEFVIKDRLILQEGDWFTQSAVEGSRQRLLRMGLFSSVAVELVDDRPDAAVRDVVIQIRERPLYAVEAGIGASVEDGPRVFLAGEARNILGLGLGVRTRGQLNYPWFTYGFVYREDDPNNPAKRFTDQPPELRWLYFFEGQALATAELPKVYGIPFDTRVHIDAVGLREIRPAFTLVRGSVLAGLDVQTFSWWRSSIEIEGEASDFDCPRDLEFGQSCGQGGDIGLTRRRDAGFIRQTTYRFSSTLDFRDDPFTPHAGFLLSFSSDVALGSGVLRATAEAIEPEPVNADFVKLAFIASGYIPLGPGFTLAVTLRGGNIFPIVSDNNYIPLYKRFYLGGTNSVRGFFEDEILPSDFDRWPSNQVEPDRGFEDLKDARNSLGGNTYVNARSELRLKLVGDLDGGIFLDAGELLEDPRNFSLGGFAAGAGVGIRYNTPVGPFAIDLGWRILDGRRQLAPLVSLERMNLHFSIGYF
jgi:outer membrane protein insertion porin family